MLILIALFSALLPVGLLVFYICRKDKDNPEPTFWLLKAGLYGVSSAILAIIWGLISSGGEDILQSFDGSLSGAFGTALFDAAIPEEAFKLFMLWLLIRKNPHFNERLDGVVYSTCVGLGFAGFENILYIFGNLDSIVSTAVMRGLFSVPGHFFFAVVMGYFVSLAYFGGLSRFKQILFWILAFIVPVILHCVYDELLISCEAIPDLAGLLVILFIAFCIWLRKFAVRRINALKAQDSAGK